MAIEDAAAGRPFDPALLGKLENLAQRGYTDGFYQRHHTHEYQNYIQGHSTSNRQQFVGEVTGFDSETGMADILVKNKFCVGDQLELILPQGNLDLTIESIKDRQGLAIDEAPGSGWEVRVGLPVDPGPTALLARYL
jgi:putative protease